MLEETFHDIIYKVRGPFWRDHTCGTGSLLENTENIRTHLPLLVSKYGISSILDAPCGDFSWMQHVSFPSGFLYTGGDIVGRLIDDNKQIYPNINFIKINLVEDTIPQVDLLFCRDLLIHLSTQNIKNFILNFLKSNTKFLLVSNYPNQHNGDCSDGTHREVNLNSAPFLFPLPLDSVDDSCGNVIRTMCLYSRDQIAESVKNWNS